MKKIFLPLLLLSGLSATANTDWGRSLCQSNGGQVSQIRLQFSATPTIEVCHLGQALIELNTLDISRFNSFGGPEANRAYRETKNYDFNACQRKFGRNIRGQDLVNTRIYNICEFNDRSWIGTDTLTNGVASPWNRELNNALGIF